MRHLLIALALAPLSAGCMTAAKEVFYTATGAQGRLTEVDRIRTLVGYDSFKVDPFTTRLDSAAPPGLMRQIVPKVTERLLASTMLTASGEKTLTIRGEVVYIDLQGMAAGALSPMEQLVCYVTLHDPAGKQLGWSVVAGVNKSRTRAGTNGISELADGLGKGVAMWLTNKGVPKREQESPL